MYSFYLLPLCYSWVLAEPFTNVGKIVRKGLLQVIG